MSTHAFVVILIVVAAVAVFGGYLIGVQSSEVAFEVDTNNASADVAAQTPDAINPFDDVDGKVNPFEEAVFNPFQ